MAVEAKALQIGKAGMRADADAVVLTVVGKDYAIAGSLLTLNDGVSADSDFDVGGWTGAARIDGGSGTDRVVSHLITLAMLISRVGTQLTL